MTPLPPLISVVLEPEADFLRLSFHLVSAADSTDIKDIAPHWAELEQSLRTYLQMQEGRWFQEKSVHLAAQDRLLDSRQLQAIAQLLKKHHLQLEWVETNRRQTAVAAASAGYSVVQKAPQIQMLSGSKEMAPLVLKNTLRSGAEVRHGGDVILWGDVNPGGEIIAEGDILIWGTLRGTAHAGAKGKQDAVIMMLRSAASQIRIADQVARVTPDDQNQGEPEVAHLTPNGIRITPLWSFKRHQHT